MQSGHGPVWRPLKRHDSHVAEQMVERAAELARDSHSQTRYAAVLVKDESLLAWGTNGVPFPGEDHCYCKLGEGGDHDRCRTHAEQRAITRRTRSPERGRPATPPDDCRETPDSPWPDAG
jgi:deoxycytidylate deaminase